MKSKKLNTGEDSEQVAERRKPLAGKSRKDDIEASTLDLKASREAALNIIEDLYIEIDQRKKAEEKYRQLFDQMIDGFALHEIICDEAGLPVDYRFIEVNEAFEQLTGLKASEVTGKTIREILPGIELEFIEHYGKVALEQIPVRLTMHARNLKKTYDISVYSPYKGAFATVFEDVTEKIAGAEIIRNTKDFYNSILDSVINGVWVTDHNDTIFYVNKGMSAIAGIPVEQILSVNTLYGFPADTLQSFRPYYQKAKERLKVVRYPAVRVITPAGRLSYQSGWLIPIIKEGAYDGMICTVEDVTENKLAEDALRSSEERFRNITEQVSEIIFMTDNTGYITYISPQVISVFGYSALEMTGEHFIRFVDETDYQKAMSAFKTSMKTNSRVQNFPARMKRKDGSVFIGEVSSNGFYVDGRSDGAIGVIRDVTERKNAEEAIRRSKETMEELHRHLTEVRENERADISREIHDQLGQSMTALKLDLNWVQEHIATDPESRAKLASMIDLASATIRDIQRISSELRPGILDDIGLAAAIEWYAEEFEKRSGIKVHLNLDEVQAESDQKNLTIFRVTQESLTNVIRHANAKKVKISLSEIKENIILEIKDDGVGMPEEKVNSPRSLGLLGIRERVAQSSGILVISSRPGSGTSIRITIPAGDEEIENR